MIHPVHIFGGGTFNHVSCHLSLSAPAYGNTARQLHKGLGGELHLTKMADTSSDMITNEDVSKRLDEILRNFNAKVIIFSCAITDFNGQLLEENQEGRLSSSEIYQMKLIPSDKIINKIKDRRPDIFVVGFKTTFSDTQESMYQKAILQVDKKVCDVVIVNDLKTRLNGIVDRESAYFSKDRQEILSILIDKIKVLDAM